MLVAILVIQALRYCLNLATRCSLVLACLDDGCFLLCPRQFNYRVPQQRKEVYTITLTVLPVVEYTDLRNTVHINTIMSWDALRLNVSVSH